jgi:hypothetical protein
MRSPLHKSLLALTALLIFIGPVSADQLGLDYPHNATNSINCWSCHYNTNNPASWATHVPQDIDDTPWNNLCWSCHNDVDAQYVLTHSSLNAGDDYGEWTIECKTCHWVHHQRQLRAYGAEGYVYSATTGAVTASTVTRSGGTAWEEDEYAGYIVVPNVNQVSYNYMIVSNTADTLTVEGPVDLTKVTAGVDTLAIIYGKLIKDEIETPNSGTKTVKFFNNTGPNSFADGDSTRDGVCEVCHTQTNHFRNDGNGPDQLHDNLGGEAGTDCIDCHAHDGFGHGGGGGTGCEECHGHDPGYGGATGGHGTYVSHSTHTENDADDLKGPNVDCSDCHDTDNFPYFKSGVDANSDGRYSLSETDVCDTCHSPGGTYGGADLMDTAVGAKAIWHTGAYVATDDSTLRSGKEKWCATCHDEEPSVIQGVTAPNIVGDEDGDFNYGTGWGFYKTGHGLDANTAFPSSGGVASGAGLQCNDCHDFTKSHIDGNARTYSSSGGSSSYRDGYRLIQVDLGDGLIDPMTMPLPQSGPNSAKVKERFALCASCHDPDPFLSSSGSTDTNLLTNGSNYHVFHMEMNNIVFDSDFTGGADSRANCNTCHNVHGSSQLAMVRDGKLVNKEPGLKIWYRNDDVVEYWPMTGQTPEPPNLTLIASTGILWIEQPTFCGACHNHSYIHASNRGGSLRWKGNMPTLDWTWEPYYKGRGIHTDRLFNTTETVPFRVTYFDPDNDAPSTIELWIDHNDNGEYEEGETTVMVQDDPGDTTYTDGKIYKADVELTNPGDNEIKYRVYASDGTNDAVGQPTQDQTIEWDANLHRDVPGEYATIQEAIDNAYDGNTVVIADGTYAEQIDSGGKELTIVSENGAGSTTLVGDGAGQACITFSSGADSATIDGFTIDNQHESQNGPARGIVIESGVEVTVKNSVITGNHPRTGNLGGGIYLDGGGLVLENTSVSDNWSMNGGGGIYAANAMSGITITDSTIDNNSGQNYPGLYLVSCSEPTVITRTSISGNDSSNSGAGINADNSPIELYDCTVDNNEGGDASGEHGGGIRLTGTDSTAYIEGGSISGNHGGGYGGGIYLDGVAGADPLVVTDVDMSGNSSGSYGGALYANVSGTVTLTNVNMDNSSSYHSGGAIHANCPVVLESCSLNDCQVTHGGGDDHGGAAYISGTNSSLSITDTPIHNPDAGTYGGAIFVSGSTQATPLSLTNVEITNGSARSGGGIYVTGCTNASTLTNVTVDGCTTYSGGGGIWTDSSMTITGSTISNNSMSHAPENGGGIYATGGSTVLTITDTDVTNNQSNYGAGIAAYVQQLDITGGSISSNTSNGANPGYNGGGLNCSGTVTLDSVYIQGNVCGQKGGGVYCSSGSLAITNCTITGNKTGTHSSSMGGGIYSSVAESIINSTVTSNFSRQIGGIRGGGGTVKNSIVRDNTASVAYPNAYNTTVSYSDINGTGYTDGGNNIDEVPDFVTPSSAYPSTDGDFHLKGTSPCIGAADETVAPDDDIDGDSRLPHVAGQNDMGADEYMP